MSAVGLTDVYQYGTRLLGALLVVAGVGGGLIAAGYVLIQNGSLSSLPGNAGYRAALGIIVVALGGLLLLSGLLGLAHKLIADATMAGALAARAAQRDVNGTTTGNSSSNDRTATETTDDSSATAPEPAADASGNTGIHAPTQQQPDPPGSATSPAVPDSSTAEIDSDPVTAAADDTTAPATGEGETAATTASQADQPAEDTARPDPGMADDTAAVSDSSTEFPVDSDAADPQSKPGGRPDRDILAEGSDGPEQSTEPREWTPPDPAEFDAGNEDPVPGGNKSPPADGWEPKSKADTQSDGPGGDGLDRHDTVTEDTRLLDEPDRGDASAGPRTTDDLFGDAADEQGAGVDEHEQDKAESQDAGPVEEDSTLSDAGTTGSDVSDDDPLSDPLDDE